MLSQWCYFEKALSDEKCESLISHLESKYEYQESTIGFRENNKIKEDFRNCKVSWINPLKEEKLTSLLWYYANRANRDFFNLDIQYIGDIQLTKYKGDKVRPGKYDWHHDVDWMVQKGFHRKLSLSVILSDGYEGGQFEFESSLPSLPEKALQKGSIIAFPSLFTHRVAPVTSGTRHTIVTWVEGPKWR